MADGFEVTVVGMIIEQLADVELAYPTFTAVVGRPPDGPSATWGSRLPGPDTARRSRPAPSSGNTVPDSGRYGERLGGHRFQGACGGVSALKEHHPERGIDGN